MAAAKYINASEIAEYIYCPRAWWLRSNGLSKTTPQMVRGLINHESIIKKIRWNARLRVIALLLILIALMLVLLLIKGLVGI